MATVRHHLWISELGLAVYISFVLVLFIYYYSRHSTSPGSSVSLPCNDSGSLTPANLIQYPGNQVSERECCFHLLLLCVSNASPLNTCIQNFLLRPSPFITLFITFSFGTHILLKEQTCVTQFMQINLICGILLVSNAMPCNCWVVGVLLPS